MKHPSIDAIQAGLCNTAENLAHVFHVTPDFLREFVELPSNNPAEDIIYFRQQFRLAKNMQAQLEDPKRGWGVPHPLYSDYAKTRRRALTENLLIGIRAVQATGEKLHPAGVEVANLRARRLTRYVVKTVVKHPEKVILPTPYLTEEQIVALTSLEPALPGLINWPTRRLLHRAARLKAQPASISRTEWQQQLRTSPNFLDWLTPGEQEAAKQATSELFARTRQRRA
jgi:hypothetical protein